MRPGIQRQSTKVVGAILCFPLEWHCLWGCHHWPRLRWSLGPCRVWIQVDICPDGCYVIRLKDTFNFLKHLCWRVCLSHSWNILRRIWTLKVAMLCQAGLFGPLQDWCNTNMSRTLFFETIHERFEDGITLWHLPEYEYALCFRATKDLATVWSEVFHKDAYSSGELGQLKRLVRATNGPLNQFCFVLDEVLLGMPMAY